MKNFFKFILALFIVFACIPSIYAKDNYLTHYKKGIKLLDKENYSEAINEFLIAYQIEPTNLDTKSMLIYSYATRGKNFEKNNEYGNASIDYRSALFFLFYYYPEINDDLLEEGKPLMQNQLNICLKKIKFKNTAQNHYMTAKFLELIGEYPAAVYEYYQTTKSKKYKEISEKRISEIKQNHLFELKDVN